MNRPIRIFQNWVLSSKKRIPYESLTSRAASTNVWKSSRLLQPLR